jgi:thiol-disulfide isomerase/thioredoxin
MKRPHLVLFFLSILIAWQSFAAGITFVENKSWKEVLAMAKKENKLIFLDAYATWCGPCKYMQKNVFTDDAVGDFYNTSFINVAMDMEKGEGVELSEKYDLSSYPTLFFINSDGEVIHKSVGALESVDFLALGKDALNPSTQYYTVKKNITASTTPAVLHNWLHNAEAMEDPNAASLLTDYLKNTTHPVMEKEMLSLIMDHATNIKKSMLDEIYKNRADVVKLLGATPKAFDDRFINLLVNYGVDNSQGTNGFDFKQYHKTIEEFYPKKAAVETQKEKVRQYTSGQESAKALTELTTLMTKFQQEISIQDLSIAIVDATNMIVDAKRGAEFVKKVESLTIKPADKDKAYFKDLALLMLHYRMENTQKVDLYIDRLLKDKNAPDAIKEMVESLKE